MGNVKAMLDRVQKLERTRNVSDDMVGWVRDTFTDALAQGKLCPMDGPVVMGCLLGWLSDGTARAGSAGWGPLR